MLRTFVVCSATAVSCCDPAKMLIAAVIVSFIALSSAQPSPECITAFNAIFNSAETIGCSGAYGSLFYGNASDEQRMMVCDADQQCNTMIENVITTCGNTVSGLVVISVYI